MRNNSRYGENRRSRRRSVRMHAHVRVIEKDEKINNYRTVPYRRCVVRNRVRWTRNSNGRRDDPIVSNTVAMRWCDDVHPQRRVRRALRARAQSKVYDVGARRIQFEMSSWTWHARACGPRITTGLHRGARCADRTATRSGGEDGNLRPAARADLHTVADRFGCAGHAR